MITAEGPCTSTDFLSEQLILIYLHAVAMIQQTTSGEEPFQAKIAIVPGSPATSSAGSSRNDLPAKYIGE